MTCAGLGWRPSTRLAMIKAATALTWGAAIEVPSYPEGIPKLRGEDPLKVTW